MRPHLFAVVTLSLSMLAVGAPPGTAIRSPVCTRGQTDVERDPRALLPISGTNPIAAATTAALRYERARNRPQVQAALLAVSDTQRGRQAKFSCGTRVWRRTIVVYVLDRALLPAQSAAQRVYFIGRFQSGYRVWQIVH